MLPIIELQYKCWNDFGWSLGEDWVIWTEGVLYVQGRFADVVKSKGL